MKYPECQSCLTRQMRNSMRSDYVEIRSNLDELCDDVIALLESANNKLPKTPENEGFIMPPIYINGVDIFELNYKRTWNLDLSFLNNEAK